MSYGQAKTPGLLEWPWALSEEDGRPYIKRALEAGINFFDTANVYSNGESEEVLGRAIRDFTQRDEVVLATKVWGPVRKGPNGRGLSRKAILSEVDKSLRRLGDRLHRSLHHSPLRLRHAARRDARSAQRCRARRQGPLSRRVVDARVAVHEGARHSARQRLGHVRLDAELLQPALSRRRARDAARSACRRDRDHAVVAARAWQAGASVDR